VNKTEGDSPAMGKSLGVSACTAITIGNMVGSGFYLSPAAMAHYGNLAILAWAVMGQVPSALV
jgi:APA family basic amino acid/polyamine antiporter